tara:strand:- start:883 stop:1161 length:279 start_codon:yes stop_codon:yes gene_type:complete
MSLRISDFFWEDLIEEQHQWSIEQIAMFYQTSTDEVMSALAKANEKYSDDPRSINHGLSDSDDQGSAIGSVSETSRGNVYGPAGKDRLKSSS